jgi:hypothetical protein
MDSGTLEARKMNNEEVIAALERMSQTQDVESTDISLFCFSRSKQNNMVETC